MKKKEIGSVWALIGTDNYEIIMLKFLKKKLSLADALELEPIDLVKYYHDDMNTYLNKLYEKMDAAKKEENYDALKELMEEEIFSIANKVEVPPNFILKSVTPRHFSKDMVYLMLYEIE